MNYLVSLQEADTQYGFTATFDEQDRAAILAATLDVSFKLRRGSAQLHADGDIVLTLRSPGGYSLHCVTYAGIRNQLLNPDSVVLYVPNQK